MGSFIVKDIPLGSFFSKPVYIDGQFIIAAPEMPITEELKHDLITWDFKEITSDGECQENYFSQNSGETESAADSDLSDAEHLKRAGAFYWSFHQYVEALFTKIAVTGELDFKSVAEKVKEACDIIREDRRYLLRMIENTGGGHQQSGGQNYLAAHAVTSTIISVIIGFYLRLPSHRLIELGIAALLHEVGMIKLPPQIYLSRRGLSPQERKAILTHPILSYNMLKSFDFPLVISLAALEHHERENGTGYPQKLTGNKISLYAKIIAVACSYEALTTARPHKDAKDGYTGMLDLLKNEGKQYNDTVVRALVYSLSIYPIGLYVLLSDGKRGQVVDVNPENPRCPIVQLLDEVRPDGKNKTVETSPGGPAIVRPLRQDEIKQV